MWHDNFAGVLIFRSETEHGKCDECEDLRESLKAATILADRVAISTRWDQHLARTFSDRRVYYSISDMATRFWNMMSGSTAMFGFILDGMDQSKFKTPRRHGI